eukprot:CAMPEP_0206279738 /NCGR_PEP_ID=MMETSP0047_2-20121206/38177_1 /ASSEMBLY_ACC=CAM_ASM_000192 /TAXON_ID=195065 /ORGANISM="Chroomonas mesostigmatica_cf, Strain CCMP1168" /LENGTH=342 /DNA_ID=CAMNT_0053709697 /DNA_START=168 /DNA_END=1197 /DNA_ORIENTATION=-
MLCPGASRCRSALLKHPHKQEHHVKIFRPARRFLTWSRGRQPAAQPAPHTAKRDSREERLGVPAVGHRRHTPRGDPPDGGDDGPVVAHLPVVPRLLVHLAVVARVRAALGHDAAVDEPDGRRAEEGPEGEHETPLGQTVRPGKARVLWVVDGDEGQRGVGPHELGGVDGLVDGVRVAREVARLIRVEDAPHDVDPRHEHDTGVERLPREEALHPRPLPHDLPLLLLHHQLEVLGEAADLDVLLHGLQRLRLDVTHVELDGDPPDCQPAEHPQEGNEHGGGEARVVDKERRGCRPDHAQDVDLPKPLVHPLDARVDSCDEARQAAQPDGIAEEDVGKIHVPDA